MITPAANTMQDGNKIRSYLENLTKAKAKKGDTTYFINSSTYPILGMNAGMKRADVDQKYLYLFDDIDADKSKDLTAGEIRKYFEKAIIMKNSELEYAKFIFNAAGLHSWFQSSDDFAEILRRYGYSEDEVQEIVKINKTNNENYRIKLQENVKDNKKLIKEKIDIFF